MITDERFVGASFDIKWHEIHWKKCQKNVQRLQARIVEATKVGRWNKVKSLQRILTRSFSAKALATKRVTSSKGKHTPGVDGQVWLTAPEKSEGIKTLRLRGYQPDPLRRIYIPKLNGQKRPLGIPTIRDRAMQALILLGLEPISETLSDHHSYGFRKDRSAADAMSQIHKTLAGRSRASWILEGDIRKCFDEINHEWLLENIPVEKQALHAWLKSGFMEGNNLYPTVAGTPQGGIISPVLANMTLDGLEAIIENHFGKKGTRKRKKHGVHLIRYADDFIVTGKSREDLETIVKPAIGAFLSERGLTLSSEKTKIVSVEQGFDFLGQNTRKMQSGELIIQPSTKSRNRIGESIRTIVRKNQATAAGELIKMLNPQIQGWTYYHRHACSRKAFERLDHEVFWILWRWAKRRHPNKGSRWIKAKYFRFKNSQDWCFSAKRHIRGTTEIIDLFKATDVAIRRKIKIRAKANPFDRTWYTYFKERHKKGTMIETSPMKRLYNEVMRERC